MENKYSESTQKEIDTLSRYLDQWNNLFLKEIKYYAEGWSVNLREKTVYPRYIVIFKEYHQHTFSIKSFEIHCNEMGKESFKDLYFIDNIISMDDLFNEIKNIFYGKDILSCFEAKDFKI
jgi:hypothetical protein